MVLKDFLIRIITAFILGMAVGLERQYRQRMAGVRTNVLVCVGSCLFVMFSSLETTGDRTRIASQVVTGVGFLGGGVILREGFNVRGLNTAATLWCTAAVGVLTSSGYILYAIISALIVVISNTALRPIARKMYNIENNVIDEEVVYEINIKCSEQQEFHIRSLLMHMVTEEKILLSNLESNDTEIPGKVWVKANILSMGKNDMCMERIVSRISLESGVSAAGWEID
ncbi:membrane protein [Clostridium polyendosporum]|uniref:Membrane protein n=1 Tax=Clostridium polyendosporum TaxID=69208 RepID=A0A919VEL7_9CLOT|nr:MgtC/SapB family protein [Clostridium polyendosporum]GIM29294.1 membrane protein [Clostridium polyendosporum]